MQTYTEPKELIENPGFRDQRRVSLAGLNDGMIDAPIVTIVKAFNRLPYAFTIQCCYGHFLYTGQRNPHNLEPLPVMEGTAQVEYRIAYLAFCIENSDSGRWLLQVLQDLTFLDQDNIQLGSAEWFWERQVNSYALQVEPERYKHQDRAILEYAEATRIEATRKAFFSALEQVLREQGQFDRSGPT